ncbi:MAG TPA: DUF935 domain-containing protein [Azospirillum sp.]|nr:DUF935 domain-containing protein [Azospirillum sp.]
MPTVLSPILGPEGQPIRREVLTEEIAGPSVTGVRQVLADHPSYGLTPARLGTILRAAEGGDTAAYLALCEDIEEKFIHFRSVLATRRLAVSGLEVTVEAASDKLEDVAAADLVREIVADPEFPDALYDLLDGLAKGYAVSEIVWETSERQWMPRKLIWREPSWFQFDRVDHTTLRMRESGYPDGRDLDLFKFIVHRPRTKSGIPIRGGLARPACWAWLFTSFGTKDWLSFVETYGQPIRVGRYGPGASKSDMDALLRAVRNIAADAAAIIPQSMMLEFIRAEGASANADIFKGLVEFFERQTSKLVLGQTTTTDAISGGHAVSQEHRQVQEDIERADARQLAATLMRDLAAPAVALNIPKAKPPLLRIGRPDQQDLKLQLEALKTLVPMGMKVSMSEVRDRYNFSDPDEGDELLAAPSASAPDPAADPAGSPAAPPPPARGPADKALAAAQIPGADDGDAVDRLVDEMLGDWEPLAAPLVEAVIQAAREAAGPEEFLRRLADLAGAADLAPLQDMLARGQFVARVAARAGVMGGGNV